MCEYKPVYIQYELYRGIPEDVQMLKIASEVIERLGSPEDQRRVVNWLYEKYGQNQKGPPPTPNDEDAVGDKGF